MTETDQGIDYIRQVERNAGAPAQPRHIVPIAALPGTILTPRGAVLRTAVGYDETDVDPVVMLPVLTGDTGGDEPIFDTNVWFPADIVRLNSAGEQSALVFSVGQFHGSAQVQRRYSALDVTVYHNYITDWDPPQVLSVVSALVASNTVTISVVASDTSGIHAVVVAYTDGNGNWASVDLTPIGDAWRGSFPAQADSQFIPQVVDGAGNVATVTREGRYMQPGMMYPLRYVFLPLVLRGMEQ